MSLRPLITSFGMLMVALLLVTASGAGATSKTGDTAQTSYCPKGKYAVRATATSQPECVSKAVFEQEQKKQKAALAEKGMSFNEHREQALLNAQSQLEYDSIKKQIQLSGKDDANPPVFDSSSSSGSGDKPKECTLTCNKGYVLDSKACVCKTPLDCSAYGCDNGAKAKEVRQADYVYCDCSEGGKSSSSSSGGGCIPTDAAARECAARGGKINKATCQCAGGTGSSSSSGGFTCPDPRTTWNPATGNCEYLSGSSSGISSSSGGGCTPEAIRECKLSGGFAQPTSSGGCLCKQVGIGGGEFGFGGSTSSSSSSGSGGECKIKGCETGFVLVDCQCVPKVSGSSSGSGLCSEQAIAKCRDANGVMGEDCQCREKVTGGGKECRDAKGNVGTLNEAGVCIVTSGGSSSSGSSSSGGRCPGVVCLSTIGTDSSCKCSIGSSVGGTCPKGYIPGPPDGKTCVPSSSSSSSSGSSSGSVCNATTLQCPPHMAKDLEDCKCVNLCGAATANPCGLAGVGGGCDKPPVQLYFDASPKGPTCSPQEGYCTVIGSRYTTCPDGYLLDVSTCTCFKRACQLVPYVCDQVGPDCDCYCPNKTSCPAGQIWDSYDCKCAIAPPAKV